MARGSHDGHIDVRLANAAEQINRGEVPSWIYNDPEIFRLEKERLFTRAWVYLAHESEIPAPGDFVVRNIVDDSILVVRGADGQIRVFLNQCTHRGSQLCQFGAGNLRRFRCIYHGWTFNDTGALVGVPYDREIYGGVDRDELRLRSVPHYALHDELIFACMDPDAPSFEEYLGDFAWYLDFLTKRSVAGLEVLGPPQRWIVNADWKIAAENLIGDSYHTPFSHRSIFDIGLLPFSAKDARPGGAKTGLHVRVGNADLALVQRQGTAYMGYPASVLQTLASRLDPDQRKLLESGAPNGAGTFMNRFHLFPNLSCLNVGAFVDGERLDPYVSLRIWQPIAPAKMEIVSWLLVERDASPEFKKASRRAYVLSFGPSGMLEQDDMENWTTISRVALGAAGGATRQFLRMGAHDPVAPIRDWPGPGDAYPTQYFDLPAQGFLERWLEYLR
jgi:PAH dioxygenase large subunit